MTPWKHYCHAQKRVWVTMKLPCPHCHQEPAAQEPLGVPGGESTAQSPVRAGLKNHHIAQLVNAVRDKVKEDFKVPHEWLRESIAHAVVDYLRENNLMLDSQVKDYS